MITMSYTEQEMNTKKNKKVSSKKKSQKLSYPFSKLIQDKNLEKSSLNFVKALHGKKIRNTSNT